MTPAYAHFDAAVQALAPRTAVVLGSGLVEAAAAFRVHAAVGFAEVPGLVPPTVHGHPGRLAAGTWGDTPALVYFGRLHFYEGHPWDVVTEPVRTLIGLGVKTLILTNATGGIHPSLGPGGLMALCGHVTLLAPACWRAIAAGAAPAAPYSRRLIQILQEFEAAAGRELLAGVYAALTGPSYETPAEIRALAALGADAVGMSTAKEAEAAAALGLEVAAISCVTNRAAGLSDAPLDHAEVLVNAKLAVGRLSELLGQIVRYSETK